MDTLQRSLSESCFTDEDEEIGLVPRDSQIPSSTASSESHAESDHLLNLQHKINSATAAAHQIHAGQRQLSFSVENILDLVVLGITNSQFLIFQALTWMIRTTLSMIGQMTRMILVLTLKGMTLI